MSETTFLNTCAIHFFENEVCHGNAKADYASEIVLPIFQHLHTSKGHKMPKKGGKCPNNTYSQLEQRQSIMDISFSFGARIFVG